MVELILSALPIAIVASTPLLLTVQGELVTQRAGMINLGVEGMLLGAALAAVVSAQVGGSVLAGFAGGILGAALIALIFGAFTLSLRADQIVTGTAINLLALGLTSFAWRELRTRQTFADATPPLQTDFVLPLAWIVIPIALGIVLWNSRVGLRLRAAGENPEALAAAGTSPARHRWLALAVEALLVGIGGAYLALATANGFAENMSAGRGFIALAIVIFGRWKVKGALLGTAIFGIAAALQFALQASSQGLPYHLLLAVPYVVTLLILCGATGRVRAPQALGK